MVIRGGKLFILKQWSSFCLPLYRRVPHLPRTVGEVAGEYPDKTLLITMEGHITCSVPGGIIMDSFDCRKRIAEDAWIIK